MPFIQFEDSTRLWYEDSGPVANNTHVTLVLVHGVGFNAGVFKPLFPVASKHNFRIIAVHRRGYSPSSPLTDDDIRLMKGSAEDQIKAIHKQGAQLAEFLHRLVETENIPEANEERKGGIALLGWSLGSSFVHAMLSSFDQVPDVTVQKLTKYLHTAIFYDPSSTSIGCVFPPPPDADASFLASNDLKFAFEGIKKYISGYFTHPNPSFTSGNPTTLDLAAAPTLPVRPPTFHDTPLEEMKPILVVGSSLSPDFAAFAFVASSKEVVRRAVFDPSLASGYLPHLRVRYYYGENTAGSLVRTMWFFEQGLREIPGPFGRTDGKGRDVKCMGALKGNHFYDPEEVLEQWTTCIDA